MVGKQAMQAVAEKQNRATTLKDAIINASEDYTLVVKELQRKEKDKAVKDMDGKEEQTINVQDLKNNAEKLVLDIEGR